MANGYQLSAENHRPQANNAINFVLIKTNLPIHKNGQK
jgi:hypothetical protein